MLKKEWDAMWKNAQLALEDNLPVPEGDSKTAKAKRGLIARRILLAGQAGAASTDKAYMKELRENG